MVGRTGHVVQAGHAGKPDCAGKPGHTGKPDCVGKPGRAGKPGHVGRLDRAGKAWNPRQPGRPAPLCMVIGPRPWYWL